MNRLILLPALAVMGCALPLLAQIPPVPTTQNLAVPLLLPPGNIEVLQINPDISYMGDAPRIVDCPDNADNPFGACGNVLFGGVGLWNSHLNGAIQVKFYPAVLGIAHFEITHPFDLTGNDSVLSTPQLYSYPAQQNVILDTFNGYTSGDLNLNTGEVLNLNYQVIFSNTWYKDFASVNPNLFPPAFAFPGVYGQATMTFSQRTDGLLDVTFYGSTFLPLGNNINGAPVRLPMPFNGPLISSPSIQVPGLSLHPHLSLSTVPSNTPACGSGCPNTPSNTVLQFNLNSAFSSIGDDFDLLVPSFGGFAEGRSQMIGRIEAQFGQEPVGNYVPIAFNPLPPEGLLVTPPAFPAAGISLGPLGFDERLRFPNITYTVDGPALADDPFDFAVGELNLKTGHMVNNLFWRVFFTHDLLQAILAQNNGRILPVSFLFNGQAFFQTGLNGSLMFRYPGITFLDYSGFVFPGPDYTTAAHSYTAPTGSYLTPFFRMQGEVTYDTPTMTFNQTASLTSTYGDPISYSLNVACDGSTASFTYTNNSQRYINGPFDKGVAGGTFKMTNLSAVSCINSLDSTQPRGQYDHITFTGYGTWSNDQSPHIASVSLSTDPLAPYIGIQIDGATLSNADTKPVVPPKP